MKRLLRLARITASLAGRKKIAHRFIGGHGWGRGKSHARDGSILSSLTGLAPSSRSDPPMNRWAIFFRPAGLANDAHKARRGQSALQNVAAISGARRKASRSWRARPAASRPLFIAARCAALFFHFATQVPFSSTHSFPPALASVPFGYAVEFVAVSEVKNIIPLVCAGESFSSLALAAATV